MFIWSRDREFKIEIAWKQRVTVGTISLIIVGCRGGVRHFFTHSYNLAELKNILYDKRLGECLEKIIKDKSVEKLRGGKFAGSGAVSRKLNRCITKREGEKYTNSSSRL